MSRTQDFIPLKEARDGVAVLNDGSLRAVLMASSLNFALKSEDEQNSILYQFQTFLNTLDFSVQIHIQSRRMDIRPYMALLEEQYKSQTNDLMKLQIQEYIEFIKNFTESTNIMTKSFFIVVPYAKPVLTQHGGILDTVKGLLGMGSDKEEQKQQAQEAFEENRSQLEQRVSVVEQGLSRTGVRVARLGNEEIIELFYKIFNPGETEKPLQLTKNDRNG